MNFYFFKLCMTMCATFSLTLLGMDGITCITLRGHKGPVASAIKSGNKVITGSWDQTVKIWDVNDGRCLRTLKNNVGPICSVTTIDDKVIITSVVFEVIPNVPGYCTRTWDLNTGCCSFDATTIQGLSDDSGVTKVFNNTDGDKSVICHGKVATVVGNGYCLHTLTGHTAQVLTAVIAGDTVVTGSEDCTAKIWRDTRPAARRQEFLALAVALQPRCGRNSPARVLPQPLWKEMCEHIIPVIPEPWAASATPLEIHELDENQHGRCTIC